jgi:hypothetical protein
MTHLWVSGAHILQVPTYIGTLVYDKVGYVMLVVLYNNLSTKNCELKFKIQNNVLSFFRYALDSAIVILATSRASK